MPAFKCKFCGGDVFAEEGQSVAVCEYCQREQSLTKSKSEIVVNLFNRANSLRLKNEFDKSMEVYEKILAEEPDDAEAHWGIVLCKYGIEYVKENEWTYSEIPTCHRTQYESILADVDYLAAIENADAAQKVCYESEAKQIAELQKSVLEVVRNEKPFDVFICYKEKDEYGNRTVDSGIANDIYYQLTQEGFKVFYAAITLEDKLGTAYEPYIFAALNSAKVMLVLGTKPEYFHAVWVKNEWARYLKIIKNDRSRILIPCYRDMDAYELPEEFAHLQAQDMAKVGFITDIIRGIKKIIPRETEKVQSSELTATKYASVSDAAAPILKRVFLTLEDGDFQKAETLIEQVLNLDPECAEAYIAKMMIDKKISTRDALYNLDFDLKDNPMYVRAFRFASDEYKTVLAEYRKESIYRRANGYLEQNTINGYNLAKRLYGDVIDYKDAREKRDSCDIGLAEIDYKKACILKREAKNFSDTTRVLEAAGIFKRLGNYKDSKSQAEECTELEKLIPYKNALRAKEALANSKNTASANRYYNEATSLLADLGDYKDSSVQKAECEQLRLETLYHIACSIRTQADVQKNLSQYQEAAFIFSQIANYKDSSEQRDECNKEIESINAEIARKNEIEKLQAARESNIKKLQTEWKQLFSSEKEFLSLKEQNAVIEKTKIRRRILLAAYIVLAAIFAVSRYYHIDDAIKLLEDFLSEIIDQGPVAFVVEEVTLTKKTLEALPVFCVCILAADLISMFTTTKVFVWYANAIGILIAPWLTVALNIKRFFFPVSGSDNKISILWKKNKAYIASIQKKKEEIEAELNTLIGSDEFNNFKASVAAPDVTQQESTLNQKSLIVAKIIYILVVAVLVAIFWI